MPIDAKPLFRPDALRPRLSAFTLPPQLRADRDSTGFEAITDLRIELTQACPAGSPLHVGPIEASNAHEAALAVTAQIVADLSKPRTPTIAQGDLDRVADLVLKEAQNLVYNRIPAAQYESR